MEDEEMSDIRNMFEDNSHDLFGSKGVNTSSPNNSVGLRSTRDAIGEDDSGRKIYGEAQETTLEWMRRKTSIANLGK